MGKGFNAHNTKTAAHEAKIRNPQLQIEDLKPRKRTKLPLNPNTRFVDIIQVEETRLRLEEQLNGTQIVRPIEIHEVGSMMIVRADSLRNCYLNQFC